ncbi:MAG: thioredoxin domain-containing protein [Steroidobacteraceae bacterium]
MTSANATFLAALEAQDGHIGAAQVIRRRRLRSGQIHRDEIQFGMMGRVFYFMTKALMAQLPGNALANALAGSTSPYLLQHAHNPVHWHPWGAEALALARSSGKPILLSVGYSACHWCHVMAHESFEDPATAAVMNDLFVNIKVDREERPDIDRIYQIAQQLLTQRGGGWPLTMFLTHNDQKPFFGGTYFPPVARHGLPAFKDLLPRIGEYYRTRQPELREQGDALMRAFDALMPAPADPAQPLDEAPLRQARTALQKAFDGDHGGFGTAPKFPHPLTLERLLRDWYATSAAEQPDLQALYMASLTLRRMADGGLQDHLAGGFCRYSVDARWSIPHFEKMLYDNGALLSVYALAASATGDEFYAQVTTNTAEFLLAAMQSPEGGFYSSFDADSEGHEGRYYVWTREEVQKLLSEQEFAVLAPHLGLDGPANFEGTWHLRVTEDADPSSRSVLQSAKATLLAARARRVPPGLDDKILTSWNALAIRGLALAGRALQREQFTAAATRALTCIRTTLWRDGRLLATANVSAFLDDYVLLVDAILELQTLRFDPAELEFARELIEVVLARFSAPAGGFYFTADDHEALIHRSKAFADDATPSGNGIAALVLQRMGYLLGESRYLEAAERTLRAALPAMLRYPMGHISLLNALDEYLQPPEIVILRGRRDVLTAWQRNLAKLYAPRRLVLAVPDDLTGVPHALADKPARGAAIAYVCRGSVCAAPVDTLAALAVTLR